jgi:outer membrane protein TolC
MAENELIRLQEARNDLSRSVSDDETQLKLLMNRDPFGPLVKPMTVPMPNRDHYSADKFRDSLLKSRPEIRSTEAGLTVAKAKLELARREWIPDPTVSVEAQRYNGAAQGVSEVSAGVSFNVPWLNGKKYRAEEREAACGVEAAQRALESARTLGFGLLRDQLQKIETTHHHVELFQTRLIPNARQTVETNRTNYAGGKTGFLDLLLSERSLQELEAMFQHHLADYHIAVAELKAIVGTDLSHPSPHKKASKGGAQ